MSDKRRYDNAGNESFTVGPSPEYLALLHGEIEAAEYVQLTRERVGREVAADHARRFALLRRKPLWRRVIGRFRGAR